MNDRPTRFEAVIQSEDKKKQKENPFIKSNSNLKTSKTIIENTESSEVSMDIDTSDEIPESPKKKNISKKELKNIFSDASAKNNGVPKTFYMYTDNLKNLEKLAKQNNISVSKVLNELLHHIFNDI